MMDRCRRVIAALLPVLVALGVSTPGAASSPSQVGTPASPEPLQRVLEAFAEGQAVDGLTVANDIAGAPIAAQFQVAVNLGDGPTFGDADVETGPFGVSETEAGDPALQPLSAFFSRRFRSIPPLSPALASEGPVALNELLPGWRVYDDAGPFTGEVVIGEQPVLIWGVELTEPFDESCGTPRWVGRAWLGRAFGNNPPFDDDHLPPSHRALVGDHHRLLELACEGQGAVPAVQASATGSFGATGVKAFVDGAHVVFVHPLRTLRGAVEPAVFANGADGGDVQIAMGDPDLATLVPNPYAQLPVRVELTREIAEGEGSSAALARVAGSVTTAMHHAEGGIVLVGFECVLRSFTLFAPEPLSGDGVVPLWLPNHSFWVDGIGQGGGLAYTAMYPGGASEAVELNLDDGTWSAQVEQAEGSEDPDCEANGTFVVTEGDEAPERDVADPGTTDGVTSAADEGGLPVGPIAVGLLVGLGGLAYGLRRRGTTTAPPPTDEPGSSVPPPVPTTEEQCTVTCSIEIEAPETLGVCCMRPVYRLREAAEPGGPVEVDPSWIHLDADVEGEGWDLFDRMFEARVDASCDAGGRGDLDRATYDWSVEGFDDRLELSCRVEVPVDCPDGHDHGPVPCYATASVPYHDAPCIVRVIITQSGMFDDAVDHVDVEIICGEYREVFGFFATDRTLGATLFGDRGQVIRHRADEAAIHPSRGVSTGIKDEIGAEYTNSHKGEDLTIFTIEPEDCGACVELRRYWERLAYAPGTYWLQARNCTTQAWKSLQSAGLFSEPAGQLSAPIHPVAFRIRFATWSERSASGLSGGVRIGEPIEIRR